MMLVTQSGTWSEQAFFEHIAAYIHYWLSWATKRVALKILDLFDKLAPWEYEAR